MPHRNKGKGKKKSPNKQKDREQPKLDNFLSTPLNKNEQEDIKKRTPPSLENTAPPKKLNMSNHSLVGETSDSSNDSSDSESDGECEMEVSTPCSETRHNPPLKRAETKGDEESLTRKIEVEEESQLDKKLRCMEKRITATITASIEKLIEIALEPLRDDVQKLNTASRLQLTKMDDITATHNENKRLLASMKSIQKENKELKRRLQNIEDKLLENNVIITGVSEEAWEIESNLKEKCIQMIAYTVNAQDPQVQLNKARAARIVKVKRLGNYSKYRGRPISIKFEKHSEAQYFWENKNYLPEGVQVRREYSEETEHQRRILRPIFNAAKKHPNYKGRCKMDGGTLILKGKSFTTENLSELPEELNGFRVSSRTRNDALGFYGELNPLLNFHASVFQLNGRKFLSSEQFIQYSKAMYFNDTNTANKILQAETAIECKRLSKDISIVYEKDHWANVAKEICYPGIKEKFAQNPRLLDLLVSTGDKVLVESSFDRLWGTGVPIHHQSCLNKDQWISPGILGEILMRVRRELSCIATPIAIPSGNTGTLV